ncbi:MAG: carboxylate-amine ligase [Rhodospirillales bacterium]|nr:carboxylate-amine ligase [Rhodospirillales bacterium]
MPSPFNEPPLTIGIEEEYLLVDRESRDLASPPDALLDQCQNLIPEQVSPEFLRAQIEVGTRVCDNVQEAKTELKFLRQSVADISQQYGLAPIAASTHPFAKWQEQEYTDRARYHMLAKDLQAVARRLVICGMHVHVGIDDDELRIDLMNQVSYFLPHLLALSTSSPFWHGKDTGLRSYRLSVFNELPRTGLPENFASFREYERHVKVLQAAGLIEDASMLWWDVRPSVRFPTLEMRITDVCTNLDDAIGIAALFVCIIRMLCRLRRENKRWRNYAHMLINENRWRAQRYGMEEGLVDFGKGAVVPYAELLDELIDMVREDAEALGCLAEVENTKKTVLRGSSAHRQVEVYSELIADGVSEDNALKGVVDMLIKETVAGY